MESVFTSSLRRRPEWATAVSVLLSSQSMKWREVRLLEHDLVVPYTTGRDQPSQVFYFLLLSAADSDNSETQQKIQHLCHNVAHVGIVLLKDGGNGCNAFSKFQLQMILHSFEIPILPLSSPSLLASTIEAFQRRLGSALPVMPPTIGSRDVLPYCSNPPLSKNTANILSGYYQGFRDLVGGMSTQEGRDYVCNYIGTDAEALFRFWDGEWMLEIPKV